VRRTEIDDLPGQTADEIGEGETSALERDVDVLGCGGPTWATETLGLHLTAGATRSAVRASRGTLRRVPRGAPHTRPR
jgi:hypothetical protein